MSTYPPKPSCPPKPATPNGSPICLLTILCSFGIERAETVLNNTKAINRKNLILEEFELYFVSKKRIRNLKIKVC